MGGRFISYKEYIITLKGANAYHPWEEMPLLE
jgi:hypothetical protein